MSTSDLLTKLQTWKDDASKLSLVMWEWVLGSRELLLTLAIMPDQAVREGHARNIIDQAKALIDAASKYAPIDREHLILEANEIADGAREFIK